MALFLKGPRSLLQGYICIFGMPNWSTKLLELNSQLSHWFACKIRQIILTKILFCPIYILVESILYFVIKVVDEIYVL